MMRALSALFVLPLLFGISGCIGHADIVDEVDTIAWDLRPLEIESEVELSVGRAILGLASTVAHFADDPDAERAIEFIDDIDEVHVGVYTLIGSRSDAPVDLGLDAREELEDLGWTLVVRNRDDQESAQWVMARPAKGENFEVLVVSIETGELAVIKLLGDLGGVIDSAVRGEDDLVVATRHFEDHAY